MTANNYFEILKISWKKLDLSRFMNYFLVDSYICLLDHHPLISDLVPVLLKYFIFNILNMSKQKPSYREDIAFDITKGTVFLYLFTFFRVNIKFYNKPIS